MGLHQSGLMLDSRITFSHFLVSSNMNFPKSEDVINIGSAPKPISRALLVGSASTALISLLSLSTTSAGVFFRRADAVPTDRLVAWHEFSHGGKVRQCIQTLRAGHREGT